MGKREREKEKETQRGGDTENQMSSTRADSV